MQGEDLEVRCHACVPAVDCAQATISSATHMDPADRSQGPRGWQWERGQEQYDQTPMQVWFAGAAFACPHCKAPLRICNAEGSSRTSIKRPLVLTSWKKSSMLTPWEKMSSLWFGTLLARRNSILSHAHTTEVLQSHAHRATNCLVKPALWQQRFARCCLGFSPACAVHMSSKLCHLRSRRTLHRCWSCSSGVLHHRPSLLPSSHQVEE